MSSAKSKVISIPQLVEEIRKLFPDTLEMPRLPILECVLLAILRENHPLASALKALNHLRSRDNFFDWNEVRVSDLKEIQSYLSDYPDSEARAKAIKRFLKDLFRHNYKFEVEGIAKKTWKEAKDDLANYVALTNDHHLAHVQVLTFGGHAFPVDNRLLILFQRLGLVELSAEPSSIRGLLEKNISKAQILQTIAMFEKFVDTVCTEKDPACRSCPFNSICADYQNRLNPPKPKAPAKASGKKETTAQPVDKNELTKNIQDKSKSGKSSNRSDKQNKEEAKSSSAIPDMPPKSEEGENTPTTLSSTPDVEVKKKSSSATKKVVKNVQNSAESALKEPAETTDSVKPSGKTQGVKKSSSDKKSAKNSTVNVKQKTVKSKTAKAESQSNSKVSEQSDTAPKIPVTKLKVPKSKKSK